MRSTSIRGVLGWLAAGLMFLLGSICAWGYPRGGNLPGVSHLGMAHDLAVGRTATFAYDASGNLTNDGRRGFTYDAHDRLESVQVAGAWRTQFVHDGLNRLRVRTEFTWSGGAWVTNAVVRYVYAGGLVVEERNGSNNATTVAYTRRLDFSGSLGGAGGIGGLLALTRYDTPSPSHAWYHADGSGNVTALANANQYVVARYQYDPFGGVVAQSGPWSEANRLRFSSKEWHAASGTYAFGRRFCDPGLQRWLNPDPIGIAGGINLYGFVGNNPIGNVDPWGLAIDEDDEYGGPMQISGRAFDSVLYDSETRAAHDQVMRDAEKPTGELVETVSVFMPLPGGKLIQKAGSKAAEYSWPWLKRVFGGAAEWLAQAFRKLVGREALVADEMAAKTGIPRNAAVFEIETQGGMLTRDGRILQNGAVKSRTDFLNQTPVRRVDFDHAHGNLGAPHVNPLHVNPNNPSLINAGRPRPPEPGEYLSPVLSDPRIQGGVFRQ